MEIELEETGAVVEEEGLKVEQTHHDTEQRAAAEDFGQGVYSVLEVVMLVLASQFAVLGLVHIDQSQLPAGESEQEDEENVKGRGKEQTHGREVPQHPASDVVQEDVEQSDTQFGDLVGQLGNEQCASDVVNKAISSGHMGEQCLQ